MSSFNVFYYKYKNHNSFLVGCYYLIYTLLLLYISVIFTNLSKNSYHYILTKITPRILYDVNTKEFSNNNEKLLVIKYKILLSNVNI